MSATVKSLPCRVYYEDTDAGGVVYYANYLKFYERARSEFLRSLGYEQDELLTRNIVFVVRHVDADYRAPAYFNEMLEVTTQVHVLKKASLIFEQQVLTQRDQHQVLLNRALIKVACVDTRAFRACVIPADIYEKLSQ